MEARALRLFFGLPLPSDLREPLHRWRQRQPETEGWSRPPGLHLTLAFLGQRPALALSGLEEVATAVAGRHASLVLHTAALGGFPRSGATRLLWLGLAPSPELAALADDLRGALHAAEESFDTKAFHPHVTLARFRQPRSLDGFLAPPVLPFTTDRLTLFESRSQGGYTELQSWPLRRV